MSNYFPEKFKQLRKTRDLTQEQIADIFHVSPQTVSRWETGANYPDVETLPHIAIFFQITIDELLCTEAIRGEAKARGYVRDIRNQLNSGQLENAIDTARKATKEYPLNHDLQFLLIDALTTDPDDKYKDEVLLIGERILSNPNAHLPIKFALVQHYSRWGMKDEAKNIVHTMPEEAWHTQDLALGYVLEGEEWLANQRLRLVRFRIMLNVLIEDYAYLAGLSPLEIIECLDTITQIENLTNRLTNGEEGDSRITNAFRNVEIAKQYINAGETEKALLYVENAVQDALHHTNIMDKTREEDGGNYFAWSTPRNLCWMLWEDSLAQQEFDAVRSVPKFVECVGVLKANSKEI